MTLHLQKLCVGAESVEDLEIWIRRTLARQRQEGETPRHFHITRMAPAKVSDLLSDGSLYWVIKGAIQARQRLVAIEPFRDSDNVGRCRLVLDPLVHRTVPKPRRPFQGWRYLDVADAPSDLHLGDDAAWSEFPVHLRRELAELGLL